MNSIRNVQRALEFEFNRQCKALEDGEKIYQETRSFDAINGRTIPMRSKEMAHDYRYFPEPDLPPVIVTEEYVNKVKANLPTLPEELFIKYTTVYGLPEYDAYWLSDDKHTAMYFEGIIQQSTNYKSAANWMMGAVRSWLNENGTEILSFPLQPVKIAQIIQLIDDGKISSTGAQKIFAALLVNPQEDPSEMATKLNLIQESNSDALSSLVELVLNNFPDKVDEYKAGKRGLLGLFVGEVMKLSHGKADPKVTTALLKQKLD
jgi:aspartyl-tRNA(Asn)/glutamyl-tRNA(Gln) amidotransferase subunit B